jgi:DNA-binding LytR/AlgR family response regulator
MLNNSLRNLERKLHAGTFIRVHRKFIVNFQKIDFLEKNLLYIGKAGIPIGRLYREKLLQKLNLL